MIGLIKKIPGWKSRIGRRLIVYILLFSSVITLIGTGLQLYLDFDRDIKSIHTIFKQVESSYLQSIINSLWVSDDELLRIQLEGILRLPDMQLVEIRKGTEVLEGIGTPQSESILEQTIPLIYVYNGRDVHLGDLHVVASLKGVYARILDRVLVILSVQTVKTFLVSLFIFIIFYQLVGKHIVHLASFAESIRFESIDQRLHLNRKSKAKRPDELNQLASSFNRMLKELARGISERKRAEAERDQLLLDTSERVKELRCAYGVVESIRARATLEQVFEDVVALIPPGWQYPEITRGRIRFDDKEFVLEPFEETEWRQSADIVIEGVPQGMVEVFYQEACPKQDEGPFLQEERDLIDGIARTLSEAVEHHQANAKREKVEAQLRQALKMEAVGQLAGGVAHDFNNLLYVIQGFTEMAQRNMAVGDPAHTSLEEVRKASERAATLVSQLLAFSRRQVLDMKDVDLNDVIANLMKMIRRVIGEHIALDVLVGHELGTVRADPGQMEQILMNLCVNARDAMPTGGTITIETENVRIDDEYCASHSWATPGRYMLLSLTDTGCGMDEDTVGQIFEPFFTTKGVGEGTGLGLATVYGLVKQHKGLLHVYSEVGKGTTFKIYLPLVERSAESVGDKIEGPVPGGTETILLAEDDPSVRKLSQTILEHAGYTVLTAEDGEEALQVFEEHPDTVNLALLDVMMPKLGGRAVFDRIQEKRPAVRVLFSSGYSMNAIHTSFVLDAGLELIKKPYQRADLLRKVREVLDSGEEEG
jgi:signal transduction histidine kinase/ActR/RegA family two-component response regulator